MDGEVLFQGEAAKFELRSIVYELPMVGAALLAGSAVGAGYAMAVVRYGASMPPGAPMYIMLGLVTLGLLAVFWAASYMARGVRVHNDRLVVKMLFGERALPAFLVESVTMMDEAAARSSLLSLKYANLTPAVKNAVMIGRRNGRPWVVNLADPEGFVKAMSEMAKQSGKHE